MGLEIQQPSNSQVDARADARIAAKTVYTDEATVNLADADIGKTIVLTRTAGDQTANIATVSVGWWVKLVRAHVGDGYYTIVTPDADYAITIDQDALAAGASMQSINDALSEITIYCPAANSLRAVGWRS